MLEAFYTDIKDHMEKAILVMQEEYTRLRTGRATTALLDTVKVDYYGTVTPLSQMASVTAPEPRMLMIQPWDQSAVAIIEKAILTADLGLTPQNDGKLIRLPIPPLTEERRKEIVKIAHKEAEECRVAIRNIRRHGMEDLKKMEKEKNLSEDDHKRAHHKVQEFTDSFVARVEKLSEAKSKEILEV